MAYASVGEAKHSSSNGSVNGKQGFFERRREQRATRRETTRGAAAHDTFPRPDGNTEILPAIQGASNVDVIEHLSPAQLNPVPVLSAIGEDAARATGGKISPQAASALLHKHLAALDWRLAQARRGAINKHDTEADAANLIAADEAAAKVGARVVADSRAMVDTILRRADMRSNPDMPTQSFTNVAAATEFPAPMAGMGRPTIGEQRPARELGPGDFVLDVDATSAAEPLSMWRLVERVEELDERIVAALVDGRSLGFALDEPVWLLPPLEGRRQRDAAGDGRVPQIVAAEVKPAIPDDAASAPDPLPRRKVGARKPAGAENGQVSS